MRVVLPLVLLAACTDYGVTAHNADPTAQIVAPDDGSTVPAGPIELLGHASDPDGRGDAYDATWLVDGAIACPTAPPDDLGATRCATDLAEGPHRIELTVRDGRGGTGADRVDVTASVDPRPQVEILEPTSSGRYYADAPIPLVARLADDGDLAELVVGWADEDRPLDVVSGLSGDEAIGQVDLPEGTYLLTASATDPAGGVGQDQVAVTVGPANRAPTCAILAPLDGTSSAAGSAVELVGEVGDPDQPAPELAVTWSSDRDGPLATSVPAADGTVAAEAFLSGATHELTLRVVDERGATCVATVTHAMGNPPELVLLAPTDGSVLAEGVPVVLSATATDPEDPADALVVEWSTDLDGLLVATAPDSGGVVSAVVTPSRGTHAATLLATDTDGFTARVDSVFTVDGLPTAPTVTVSPADPRTDDDLVAAVAVPSVDPEGDAVVYRWSWLRDGVPTAFTGPTLPRAETRAGERWTARATPADPWFDGPAGEASVTVVGSPPVVTAIGLSPDPARTTDLLTCAATASDPDGDPVTLAYAWSVDGAAAGAAGPTLDGSWFAKGDRVSCVVTPSDGATTGGSALAELVVANSAPTGPSVAITPATPTPGQSLRCSVTAASTDPDGDPVALAVAWVRDGSAWTGSTGSTALPGDTIPSGITADGEGWACVVTPSDGTDVGPVGVASVGIACAASLWFSDGDGDGYGAAASATAACASPGPGWVLAGGDCADDDPARSPAATEWCDGVDDDCDGAVDEPQAADAPPWHRDADGDGFGDPAVSVPGCTAPAGYVADATDCDDADALVYPWAGDLAFDGVDGDCDGTDCEAGWLGSAYFALCFGSAGWHDARLGCQLAGYDDLASVRDASEQAALVGLLASAGASATHSPWIGLADEIVEGSWGWADLSTSAYRAWSSGEPSESWPGEDCAELNWPLGSGTWNDAACDDAASARRSWVCEAR
jgi:hypothetical protein